MNNTRFPVVFLWHMHQPEYRVRGSFRLPWVYLHALAGYTDMAVHLEAEPAARAVVNFSPVLLAQLRDYVARLRRWRDTGEAFGDPMLDALRVPPGDADRAHLAALCLMGGRNRRTDAVPRLAEFLESPAGAALDATAFTDLLVSFHLSWLGSHWRADPRAIALLQRGRGFDGDACRQLLDLIADALDQVLPRWRRLAAAGRVELAMSPYYHPLSPLLLDFHAARDAAPGTALPPHAYPGGEERLRWHFEEGLREFERTFGLRPSGCWPSEAALSDRVAQAIGAHGFAWAASAESVLRNTLQRHSGESPDPHRAFRLEHGGPALFFRDDGLSDRIGFVYQHWHADDAVAELLGHCEVIAQAPERELVLIALDGENAWEFYPSRGAEFLSRLHRALAAHQRLRPATLAEVLRERGRRATHALPPLCSGSWVHGQLLTWIGHVEKNRGWELLVAAKRAFDERAPRDEASAHLLGACEGSDWFWWPGTENPTPPVREFDALFRAHLTALYEHLGVAPPEALAHPFARGVARHVEAGGVMRPSA